MRHFLVLLRYDGKNGFSQSRVYLLNLLLILFISGCIHLFSDWWTLLNGFLLYSTLNYIFRDFDKLGVRLLTQAGKRWQWWLSKCIWIGSYILVCYGLIYLVGSLMNGMDGDYLFAPMTLRYFYVSEKVTVLQVTPLMIVVPLVLTLLLNLIQMTAALFVKPGFAFAISFILIIVSDFLTYFFEPERFLYYEQKGMPVEDQWILLLGLCVLCGIFILCGCRGFKKYDILNTIE